MSGLETVVDVAEEERALVTGRRAQRLLELELQDVTHEVTARDNTLSQSLATF